MPYKPPPSAAEMGELKAVLQKLWKEDSAILPWLRRNGHLLRKLIPQGWTWGSIAQALNELGITYKTNRPWSDKSLRSTTFKAIRPLKALPAAAPLPPGASSSDAAAEAAGTAGTGRAAASHTDPILQQSSFAPRFGAEPEPLAPVRRPKFVAATFRKNTEPLPVPTQEELERIERLKEKVFGKRT